MVGASLRGLSLLMFEKMTPGQIVDYCIEYNNVLSQDKTEDEQRTATQADFDTF